MEWIDLDYGRDYSEHCNELWGSIKVWKYLSNLQLSNWTFLKKEGRKETVSRSDYFAPLARWLINE